MESLEQKSRVEREVDISEFDMVAEFGGGLGDIYHVIYQTTTAETLWQLSPSKRAVVLMQSHNPSAETFFTILPNSHRFEVINLGYHDSWEKGLKYFKDIKTRAALPKTDEYAGNFIANLSRYSVKFLEDCLQRAYNNPVTFRPNVTLTLPVPPSDVCVALKNAAPYIVLNSVAGLPERDIPLHLETEIIRYFTERKIGVVVVGKNYTRQNRKERDYKMWQHNSFFLNLVDKVSVYDVMYLVRYAVGAVCCHSAVSMVSWHEKTPQLLLYDTDTERKHFLPYKNANLRYSQINWCFGVDYPYNLQMNFVKFEEKSAQVLDEFLSCLKVYNDRMKA